MIARRIWIWRLLALAWAVNIYWMSTGDFGGAHSGPMLARLLGVLGIHLSGPAFSVLHSVVRKLAHIVEYAALAFLIYRSLEGRLRLVWNPRSARWCIVACVAYSLTDELHQAFVSGRGPSLTDCGIDLAGAAGVVLFIYGLSRGARAFASRADARRPVISPPGEIHV